MTLNNKKTLTRAFLIYAAVNLFEYALAHTEYLFMNDVASEIISYFSYYVSKAVEFIAPPVIATLTFISYVNHGRGSALATALAVSSARLIYSLPYYYLIFVYNYRYDSVEAIILSLGASALVVLVTVAGAIVSVSIALWILKKRKGVGTDELTAIANERATLDFLDKKCLPLTVFAFLRFGFSLITELVDTVSFFIEYVADYTAAEIITILVNYVLLFILVVASYLISMLVKNVLAKTHEAENNAEN